MMLPALGEPLHESRSLALLPAALPARPLRRARLARRPDRVPLLEAALAASLEQLGSAAFLVGPDGVSHSNSRGRELLRHDATVRRTLEELARGGEAPAFSVTPLQTAAFPGCSLAVLRAEPADPRAFLQQFAARLRLTPRETEVLALLVQGLSNRTIAETLGCAERTAEQHLRFVFAKAGAETRASLIARFWTESRG